MADLLVRDLDEGLIQSLCERAAAHKCSLDTELRRIVVEALHRPKRRSFAEVLAQMPDVGTDADFARVND